MKTMASPFKIFALLIGMLLFSNLEVSAQAICPLGAGDVVFTGYDVTDDQNNGSVRDDRFSFLVLKTIAAGQEIYFTDLGYMTNGNKFQTAANAKGDGVIKWTADQSYPSGTEIVVTCKFVLSAKNKTGATIGTIAPILESYNTLVADPAAANEYMSLSDFSGDQLFAFTLNSGTFTGATTNITFLAGMSINRDGGWVANGTIDDLLGDDAVSEQPASLNDAQHIAITYSDADPDFPNDAYSARYNIVNGTVATSAVLISKFNTLSNYTINTNVSAAGQFNPFSGGGVFAVTLPVLSTVADKLNLARNAATTFSVTADIACSYLWQVKARTASVFTDLTDGGVYSGVTTNTLSISNDFTPTNLNGYQYRVLVRNAGGVTTSNAANLSIVNPAITSATYDATTHTLQVTGTNFYALAGAANDIVANKFTLTVEGGATYTLTDTPNAEVPIGGTSFSLVLSTVDFTAVQTLINKTGTSSTGGTIYNVAAAEDWDAGADDFAIIVSPTTGITVSNLRATTVTAATLDATTGELFVTGLNFYALAGANNDINATKITLRGENGGLVALNNTASAELISATSFKFIVPEADLLNLAFYLNKNGTVSTGGSTYAIITGAGYNQGNSTAIPTLVPQLTLSNYVPPVITAVQYNATSGVLTVQGKKFATLTGSNNDVNSTKITITGEAGASYTLTASTANSEAGTSFSLTLSTADKLAVNQLLNQNGTSSIGTTTYNLAAADDWNAGADPSYDISSGVNAITVSSVPVATINTVAYNAATGIFNVTGANFKSVPGASNDVIGNKFSFKLNTGYIYPLTTTPDVEITSSTAFALTLSAADKFAIQSYISKNGNTTGIGSAYILSAAAGWNAGATAANIQITASNVQIPHITSATFDAATNTFVVTGTNFSSNELDADIFSYNFSFIGETGIGSPVYISTSKDIEISSATTFSFTLAAADVAKVQTWVSANGTLSRGGTPYSITAAANWANGTDHAVNLAQSGIPITVSNFISQNTILTALTTNAGAFTPGFSRNGVAYSMTVASSQNSITITPTKQDPPATILISLNGAAYVVTGNAVASDPLTLNVGANTIDVKVQAEDPAFSKVYRLTVTRQAPASIGDFVWMDYNQNGIQDAGEPGSAGVTVTLTGTDSFGSVVNLTTNTNASGQYTFSNLNASASYRVTISGFPARYVYTYDNDGIGTAGYASLALAAGDNNTAIDFGLYDPYYTNAQLSALSTTAGLNPAFSSGVFIYTAAVPPATSSIQLTATKLAPASTLQLSVNGGTFITINSGTQTAALPLNFGNNTFEVKVTAQDGTGTTSYTTTVNRPNDPQTITFASTNSVTYGSADFAPGATSATSGINAITYTSSNTAVATIVAGKVHIVAAGTTTITTQQVASTGYDAAPDATQTLTITKIGINGAFTTQNKIYDATTDAAVLSRTLNGVLPADQADVTLTGGTASFPNADVEAGKIVSASGMALSGAKALNYTLLSVASATADITLKDVTVSFTTANKVYNRLTDATITNRTLSNVVPADALNVSATGGTATFADAAVEMGKTVTATGITLTGSKAANYNISSINTSTADITAKPITITASAGQSKAYGSSDLVLNYTSNPVLIAGDSFSGALSRTPGEVVGAYAINIGNLSAGNNYTITYAANDYTVTAAPLTITATGPAKPFGTALVAGTSTNNFTAGATQNGEVVSSITLTPDAAGTNANTPAGQAYVVTPSAATGSNGFDVNNYTINYVPYSGTVGVTAQTIAFNPLANAIYGASPIALTATSSSGLPVSYSSSNPAVATISGTTLTVVGAGTAIITASQAGNGNFTAAAPVDQSFTVNPKAIVVTASVQTKVYGAGDPALTYTNTALVGSDAFSGALSRAGGENIGTYAIGQNTLALSSNYTLTYVGADLTITAKPITVTATAGQTKVYGTADPVFAYATNTPLIGTDAFIGALTRTGGENIGAYIITQGNLALSTNYMLTYAGSTFSITAKPVTVIADAKTKIYGEANPAVYTYTTSVPLAFNDTFTGILSRTAGENVGTYTINQNTLALNSNYTLTYSSANLSISKKGLTITADDKTKFQGTPNPALTATYTGFVNGETNANLLTDVSLNTAATLASPQGNYPIAITGGTSNNYAIVLKNGTLTVTAGFPTALTLAATTVYENRPGSTPAGTFSSTSQDPGATFTYTLVTGTGSTDNASFSISGNQLLTAQSFDFETKNAYNIRVRTTTQYGLSLEQTFTVNVSDVNEIPTLTAIADQAICYVTGTQSVALSGITAGPETAQSTTISVSSNNPNLFATLSVSKTGTAGTLSYSAKTGASGTATVTVTVQDNGGTANSGTDTFTRTFTITVFALPTPSITSNKGNSVGKGETIQLTATGGTSYVWAVNSSILSGQNTAVLTVRPSVTTTYTVTATNANGCSESTSFTIAVESDYSKLKSTNILTPNNDGFNDKWVITNIDLYGNNEVKVFDKAGKLVYSKKNYDNSWDGTFNGAPLSEDTYYYIVDFGAGKGRLKGFITIIREQ